MPPFLLTAGAFLKRNWLPAVIVVLALVLVLFIFNAGGNHERAAEDKRTIQVQQHVGDANTNASAARVEDAVTAEQQKEELHNATANATPGDDTRRRAGCAILRQQGRDTAGIPACR